VRDVRRDRNRRTSVRRLEPGGSARRPSGMSSAAGGGRLVWFAVACLALTACGDQPGGTAADPTAEPGDRYTTSTTATVVEAPGHLPQLCTMGTAGRQCVPGGIDLVGWDWTGLDGSETYEGTTWGVYDLVGTYDGERFTITEPPKPYVAPEQTPGPPPATTPCPPPPDGWGVVDAASTTYAAQDAAIAYAHAQPDYAAVWVDSSMNPAWAMTESEINADTLWMFNDPTKLVLNVRFTGDLERHERALRAIWGGALCVSSGERTWADLESLRARLHDELDPLGSSVDERAGQVFLQVIVDDGLQERLDQRYGPGLVRIHALLTPVN
jgi:hypothetical protein